MPRYEIAGLKFGIPDDGSKNFNRLKAFESIFDTKPDVEIKFQLSGAFVAPKYFALQNDSISWVSETEGDKVSVYARLRGVKKTEYKIEAVNNWSDIVILHTGSAKKAQRAFCDFLGNYIISNKIIYHDGFVLHASSISHAGKGIAFTAPAGTGKSTHAAMWVKYYNADILNDDCPVIRLENGRPFIHGTPWSGYRDMSIPSCAPLSAIVFVERSAQNSIRELTAEESIPLFLPRVFLPYQNAAIMDAALQHVEKTIGNVPKYLLKCRPDREAVELVYKCIM